MSDDGTAKTVENLFICMHCKIGFAQKVQLDEHIMTHFDCRRDACKVCKQRFYRELLKVPQASSDDGKSTSVAEEPFVCDECAAKM